MMSERLPALYDVWRLEFEYEDQPGVAKARSVVIGAIDGERAVVLVAKVIGHGPRSEYPGEIRIEDWKSAGLSKPSLVRCSKTLIVPTKAFMGKLRYGRLSPRDSIAVAQGLREVGATL